MKVIVNLSSLEYSHSIPKKEKAFIFMGYKKQCISGQLISTNSSIPEGFIVHVLIEMIDPSDFFLVEIHV